VQETDVESRQVTAIYVGTKFAAVTFALPEVDGCDSTKGEVVAAIRCGRPGPAEEPDNHRILAAGTPTQVLAAIAKDVYRGRRDPLRAYRLVTQLAANLKSETISPEVRLAIASGNEAAAALDLLDASTFHRIARRGLGPGTQPFHTLAFSPDSRVLVTGYAGWNSEEGRPEPALLSRWDARTGRSLGPATPVTQPLQDVMVAFAAGGEQLVTMSEEARQTVVRDADTLRPLRRLHASGLAWASASSKGPRGGTGQV